ncbi:MAG: hypothetical protein OCD76_20080 [Reichenbachiella sp.]
MIKWAFISFGIVASTVCKAQNCNVFLYKGDTLQYEACIIGQERSGHYQFSRAYQEALDRAINYCGYFSYAYKNKSIAYLKSGDFLTWKYLIDKAVNLDPETHLAYRGWCRYQFFNDYDGAIADIERLDEIVSYDIGHCQNGDYHLKMALALCYKSIGNVQHAISIIHELFSSEDYDIYPYDYVHLGVMYLETGDLENAIFCFQKQSDIKPLADNQYYLAQAFKRKEMESEARIAIAEALKLFEKGYQMQDIYTHKADEVFLSEILDFTVK